MSAWSPFDDPIVDPGSITFTIPPGWTLDATGRCRSCKRPVAWCFHAMTGRKMPVDPDGKSHFATCPHSDFWRERGKAKHVQGTGR